jgi:phosphopantothenoylcysteine decarboxylase / phosphopantothenate---cysteine ligase
LVPTRDILAEFATRRRPDQIVVGFAAETDHLVENATAKLRSKHLDLVVANDVTEPGAGFDADTNVVTLVSAAGAKPLAKMSKLEAAGRVLDEVVEWRRNRASVAAVTRENHSKVHK